MSYRPRHAAGGISARTAARIELAWVIVAVCAALLISFAAAGVIW